METKPQDDATKDGRISAADARLAISIVEKALSFRPYIGTAILGDEFKALSLADQATESRTRRIAKFQYGEMPCLFFRFIGNELPIAESLFFPIEAVCSFIDESREFFRKHWPELPAEQIEERAIEASLDMFLIMVDNFYNRVLLMTTSFTEETIAEWRRAHLERFQRFHSALGSEMSRPTTLMPSVIADYSRKLNQLWKYQGQSETNFLKIQLAEAYDGGIHEHWKTIATLTSRSNWRLHAVVHPFEDTPSDLLDNLENRLDRRDKEKASQKLSELAVEHAARRVGLVKVFTRESVLEKRRGGIKVSDYESGTLFGFLKEGRDLIAEIQARKEFAAFDDNSAQMKNGKLIEQNVRAAQAESEDSTEQNGDSAQEGKEPENK